MHFMICVTCMVAGAFVVSGNPVDPVNKPHYDLEDAPALFEKFIKDYNRNYKDAADRQAHYEEFLKTLKNVNELNSDPKQTAVFGINNLADFTPNERKNLFGLARP